MQRRVEDDRINRRVHGIEHPAKPGDEQDQPLVPRDTFSPRPPAHEGLFHCADQRWGLSAERSAEIGGINRARLELFDRGVKVKPFEAPCYSSSPWGESISTGCSEFRAMPPTTPSRRRTENWSFSTILIATPRAHKPNRRFVRSMRPMKSSVIRKSAEITTGSFGEMRQQAMTQQIQPSSWTRWRRSSSMKGARKCSQS